MIFRLLVVLVLGFIFYWFLLLGLGYLNVRGFWWGFGKSRCVGWIFLGIEVEWGVSLVYFMWFVVLVFSCFLFCCLFFVGWFCNLVVFFFICGFYICFYFSIYSIIYNLALSILFYGDLGSFSFCWRSVDCIG